MSDDREPQAYEVGYRKPPRSTQFRPGQSGNPKGRKKGSEGHASIVDRVLNEKVEMRTARGVRKVTRFEAAIRQTLTKAMKGDPEAMDTLLRMARDYGLANQVAEQLNQAGLNALLDDDEAILAHHLPVPKASDETGS